jgi:hypothetical protein
MHLFTFSFCSCFISSFLWFFWKAATIRRSLAFKSEIPGNGSLPFSAAAAKKNQTDTCNNFHWLTVTSGTVTATRTPLGMPRFNSEKPHRHPSVALKATVIPPLECKQQAHSLNARMRKCTHVVRTEHAQRHSIKTRC